MEMQGAQMSPLPIASWGLILGDSGLVPWEIRCPLGSGDVQWSWQTPWQLDELRAYGCRCHKGGQGREWKANVNLMSQ